MSISISDIAKSLDLPFKGNGSIKIHRISNWEDADLQSLIYCDGVRKSLQLPDKLLAGCIVTSKNFFRPTWNAIISEKPKADFSRVAQLISPRPTGTGEHHRTAVISKGATIGQQVNIGAQVIIGPGAQIGAGSILQAGVVIGKGCHIGEECILHPHVVLYQGVQLGRRVTLHAGVVLGADGFGYIFDGMTHIKFPQVGGLLVEDEVEIGANTTIDRGSLGITHIGRGSKVDNLVQIAHNTKIGSSVIIASQTGISGSSTIDDNVVIAGQVGFGDHVHIKKGAIIGGQAGILPKKVLRGNEVYWGTPARPLKEFKRSYVYLSRLPKINALTNELKQRLSQIEKKLSKLLGDD